MMTLDEMKLAVCEKLPKRIFYFNGNYYWMAEKDYSPRTHHPIWWPTEGLQVCHEAEKLITATEADTYNSLLFRYCAYSLKGVNSFQWHATCEQRLEALCRVWYPERFQQ